MLLDSVLALATNAYLAVKQDHAFLLMWTGAFFWLAVLGLVLANLAAMLIPAIMRLLCHPFRKFDAMLKASIKECRKDSVDESVKTTLDPQMRKLERAVARTMNLVAADPADVNMAPPPPAALLVDDEESYEESDSENEAVQRLLGPLWFTS